MAGPDGPRTVIRRPGPPDGPGRDDLFAGLARPMLTLAAEAARAPDPDPAALAAEARRRAEEFETAALRAGASRDAVGEARDALLAVLEARALGNPALVPGRWAQARRRALPGVPEPDVELLARRRAAAEAAGPARRDLARFLRHCEEAVQAAPPPRAGGGVRWGRLAILLFLAALAAWAGWTEWRYSARLLAGMPAVEDVVRAGEASPAAAADQLDAMAAAVAAVEEGATRSPLGLAERLGRFGPGAAAKARYAAAVDALLPGVLGQAIGETLATEGGSLGLYDTLRTLAILQGGAPWQPGFVSGWLAERAGSDPALKALARHAGMLSGPPPDLPAQDEELLAQAREIAAEGEPAAFAFLELARDPRMQALPGWSPAGVPDLATVLVRRSGRPIDQAMPGLFTAAGWAAAVDGGARDAALKAATEAARVTGRSAEAPIQEEVLLEELQRRTLDAWSDELADLRVKPFTDQPGSVLISGTLGRSGSPLEALFHAVWHEVGGDDRRRTHVNQLHIATRFGPMIQFVEQGHMAEIAQLFASLNVALAALDADAEVGRRRLMDVQARAVSIATLNQAPRLLAQIVEDVLAQTTASQEGLLKPRAALAWQRDLAGPCRFALADRYPFAPGPDADLDTVRAMIGPDGALAQFLAGGLAPLLDRSESPWRWKPEARMSGFRPESAAFFERALAVGQALFPADGRAPDAGRPRPARDGDRDSRRRSGAGRDLGRAGRAHLAGPRPGHRDRRRLRHRCGSRAHRRGRDPGASSGSSTACGCAPATAASAIFSTCGSTRTAPISSSPSPARTIRPRHEGQFAGLVCPPAL